INWKYCITNPVNAFTTKYIIFKMIGSVNEYVAILYTALCFSLNPAILVTMYVKIASNSMSTKIFDKYIMKIYSIIPTNSIAMNIFISFPDKMFNTSVLSILFILYASEMV